MVIETKYGSINYDEINFNNLSRNAKDFFKYLKNLSDIFFKNKIDLTEFDKNNNFLDEILEVVLAKRFERPDKVVALARFKNVDYNDIKEEDDGERFDIKKIQASFLIYDEDEVDEKVFELAVDSFKENTDYFKYTDPEEYKDFVNKEWFNKAMHKYHIKYAEELRNEEPNSNDYINKLHEEMVKKNIMKEPSWSIDPYKNEQIDKEIDKKIDQFVKILNNKYKDGIDFWIKNYGEEDFGSTAHFEDQIDYVNLTKDFIKRYDRAEAIGTRKEEEITIDFDGEEKTFYIFEF